MDTTTYKTAAYCIGLTAHAADLSASMFGTVHSTENLARFDRAFDRGPRKDSTCFINVAN